METLVERALTTLLEGEAPFDYIAVRQLAAPRAHDRTDAVGAEFARPGIIDGLLAGGAR
jgi:hypothetical protein